MEKETSSKSKVVVILLCLFFGGLGIHRFYLGKVGTGIVMLLLTLSIIGISVSGIWALVDLIMSICGAMKDKEGKIVK